MPESATSLPVSECNTGKIMAEIEGSICSLCYAARGRYNFPNVQNKMTERLNGLSHALWVPAMVMMIRMNISKYFRWFDSGDLNSTNHLFNICQVAKHTPHIDHWLPTQEHKLVKEFDGEIPDNLTVRLSARMIDGEPPKYNTTSVVFRDTPPKGAFECPAPKQDNRCGACRVCWSFEPVVAYQLK